MQTPCFWQIVILLKDLVEGNKQTNKLRKVFLGGKDGELKKKTQNHEPALQKCSKATAEECGEY